MASEETGDARAAKDAIRRRVRARRAARSDQGGAAFARLGADFAGRAEAVALYASAGDEPDTLPLLSGLAAAGVRVLLPKLLGRRGEPDWAWFDPRQGLVPGWRGIPEPPGPGLGASALAEVGLVLCSALAVTPEGDRLGAGGGWYDRALAWTRPDALVGALCFDDEVVDALPLDPWDRRVSALITEVRVLACRRADPE